MGRFWHPDENPFWRHEWRSFEPFTFLKAVSLWLTLGTFIVLLFGCLALFAARNADPSDALPAVFCSLAVIFTLLAQIVHRGVLEQTLPQRSFADDAERGTLDFLRLLPMSSHRLVIARKFPAFAARLYAALLWMPLHAVAFALCGLPAIHAIPLALIVGVVDWNVAVAFLLLFAAPLISSDVVVLFFCLFPLLWCTRQLNRLEAPFTEGSRAWLIICGIIVSLGLFGNFVAFWLTLAKLRMDIPAFSALMAQPFYAGFLSPLWAGVVMAAVAGFVRLDRLARWLHEPKGLNRFAPLLPLAVALFFVQGFLWGILRQRFTFSAGECFIAGAVTCFGLGGLLRWGWLNWAWAEKTVPVKPPLAFLPETFAWRVVTTLMPFIGYLLADEGASLDATFILIWLMVSAIDIGCLAWSQSFALQVLARFGRIGFNALTVLSLAIASLTVVPKWNALAALSPSVGLLLFALQGKLAGMMKLPPANLLGWWVMGMAAIRWGLVAVSLAALPRLSIALGWQTMPTPFARLLRFLQQVGEWVFVIPKLEAKLLEGVNNPVFRHMVRATRWRLSWLPYFGALLFGFALSFAPFVVFATQWLIGFLLAPLFWFASYQAVHRYLRKLHQTGELWQWLITPLPSRAIVNGLRWGGWWWQMRWLGLVFWFSVGCVLSGQNLLGFLRLPLPFVFPAVQVVNLFAVGVYLLFWIALTFGAVPVAINEIFRHPRRAFAREGTMWARTQAVGYAALIFILNCICGCITLVYGLSALSMRLETSVRVLDDIRRAPMERLPLT
ncbi:MAG: hypothetical protein THHGLFOP_001561 [Candidatus Fervidibacter sp.]